MIGLSGILTIDIVTFVFAIGALLVVVMSPADDHRRRAHQARAASGRKRATDFAISSNARACWGCRLSSCSAISSSASPSPILAPMILARTGNNKLIFGTVSSAGAIGGVVGGLAMSAWGGPKRRVHGVLAGWASGEPVRHSIDGRG